MLAEEPENRVDENLTIVEGVPEWAIWYLENPNESREELEPEEREALKEFEEDYSFECIVGGSEDSFNRFPAFGLACSTVDVYAHERGKESWTEEDEEAANAELVDEVMGKMKKQAWKKQAWKNLPACRIWKSKENNRMNGKFAFLLVWLKDGREGLQKNPYPVQGNTSLSG